MEQLQSSLQLTQVLHSFIDGGWLVLFIGLGGMMARLSLATGKITIKDFIKNMIAAMFCSIITWFILEEVKIHFLYKAIIYSIVGLDAPEIIKGSVKLAHGFAQDPQSFIVQLRKGKIYGGKIDNATNNRSNSKSYRTRSKQK